MITERQTSEVFEDFGSLFARRTLRFEDFASRLNGALTLTGGELMSEFQHFHIGQTVLAGIDQSAGGD